MKFYEKALIGLGLILNLSSCGKDKFKTVGTDFYNGQKVELQERKEGRQKKLIIYGKKSGKTEIFESNAYVCGKDSFNIGDSQRDYVKEYTGGILRGSHAGPIHAKYTSRFIQESLGNKNFVSESFPSTKEKIDAKMKEANDLGNKILKTCDFE